MEKLTVRNLLVESKISDNLKLQVERLNTLSGELRELTENYKTMTGLMESNDFLTESETSLKEAVRLFKLARRSLNEAKDESNNLVKVNESVKFASKCMNDIEDLVEYEIKGYMHEALDLVESAEKKV